MALFECPRCGTKLAYASKDHPCKGGKSSDGGGESRPRAAAKSVSVGGEGGPEPRQAVVKKLRSSLPQLPAGVAPGPSETKRPAHKIIDGLKEVIAVARGETDPARVTVVRVGRPKKGETRAKPWEAEGISKASY